MDDKITLHSLLEIIRKQPELNKKKIEEYINNMDHVVEGYEDNLELITKKITDNILHYGVLTDLINENTVRMIYISSHDNIQYTDFSGGIKSWDKKFYSPQEAKIVINKLLGESVRATEDTPIVKTKTPEGFIVKAKHKSLSPDGEEYTAVIDMTAAHR